MPSSDFIDETVKVTASRRCSQCGLHVPEELDACPNDGTVIAALLPDTPVAAPIPPAYEFIEYIGKGGMSVIYKARHRYMKNVVAIKLLQDKLSQDKASFQRFRQEAEASKKLDHPNIIRVDDFGILDHGAAFLVMDFVEGRSLSDIIIDEGAMPIERAMPLLMQVCEGLAHAHNKGVLHRDLKPSNVIVVREENSTERVKIVDFGIAKMIGAGNTEANKLTSTGEVFGSPLYMSPEQCMGSDVDARSDIYSMGCLMHELLTGKPPLVSATPMETMFKHLNADPEPLSAVLDHPRAPELQKVIGRAMDKERAHRYQTFAAMLDDLHKIDRGLRVRGLRRKLPIFKLAAFGALLVAIAIIWSQTQKAPTTVARVMPVTPAQKVELAREVLERQPPPIRKSIAALRAVMRDVTDEWCAQHPGSYSSVMLRGNGAVTSKGASALINPKLVSIWLEATSVDDEFIKNLAAAKPPLVKLGIGETHVTGKSLPLLAAFPKLRYLHMESLHLTDADFEHFPEMPALEQIKLDDNATLTNRTVKLLLKQCPRLNWLTMRRTQIDDDALLMLSGIQHKFTFAVADTKVTEIHDGKFLHVSDNVPEDWRIKEMGGRAAHLLGSDKAGKHKMSSAQQK